MPIGVGVAAGAAGVICAAREVAWGPVEGHPGDLAPIDRGQAAEGADVVDGADAALQVLVFLLEGFFLASWVGVVGFEEEAGGVVEEGDETLIQAGGAALDSWLDRVADAAALR